MKATFGIDFFGCWRVFVGRECIGAFATKLDAKKCADDYNKEHGYKSE